MQYKKIRARVAAYAVLVIILASLFALSEEGVRVAVRSGERVLSGGKAQVDISNASEGYVMARHEGSSKKLKFRLTLGEETHTYDLRGDGEWETYPLQMGSGRYTVSVFQNVEGNSYSTILSEKFTADMADERSAFLYPNQQVWYTADSQAVKKSIEICQGYDDDLKKVNLIYAYVIKNVSYDYIKALTVKSGYLPDVDETLASGMGICYDYSALVACMLRAQNIPARMVKGTLFDGTKDLYHAWNEAYIQNQWVFMDATMAGAYDQDDYVASEYF